MLEGSNTIQRHWMLNLLFVPYRTYLRHIMQPPDSEILPLLIYKDVPAQQLSTPSATAHQPSQTQSEVEVSSCIYVSTIKAEGFFIHKFVL